MMLQEVTRGESQARGDYCADPDTLYKRFEHEYGFDGAYSICRQGGPVSDAIATARSNGWSPIPAEPGLLKSKQAPDR
jgi:hypothetical protein